MIEGIVERNLCEHIRVFCTKTRCTVDLDVLQRQLLHLIQKTVTKAWGT